MQYRYTNFRFLKNNISGDLHQKQYFYLLKNKVLNCLLQLFARKSSSPFPILVLSSSIVAEHAAENCLQFYNLCNFYDFKFWGVRHSQDQGRLWQFVYGWHTILIRNICHCSYVLLLLLEFFSYATQIQISYTNK